jgi:hypothetical protein
LDRSTCEDVVVVVFLKSRAGSLEDLTTKMFQFLATYIGFLSFWISLVASLGPIGGHNQNTDVPAFQKALEVGGATLCHDHVPALTAAPKPPLIKRQANSFIGYTTDAPGC